MCAPVLFPHSHLHAYIYEAAVGLQTGCECSGLQFALNEY